MDSYTFVTTARLTQDAARLAALLPPSINGVVGVARSGLIPAGVLAMIRHVPLFAANRQGYVVPCGCGWRLGAARPGKTILLVDDTVCGGTTLREVRPWVRAAFPGAEILTAAIYCPEHRRDLVDFVAEPIDAPHYLEWNYFNSSMIHKAALDCDGILCDDCPAQADDDGPRYLEFIRNVRPKYLPRREPVSAIVTARLEKYRLQTVDWLSHWGVRSNRLIMYPGTMRERNQPGEIVRWKAQQYRDLPLAMFVESDPRQAPEIARLAGKPCMCPAAERIFVP